MLKYIYLFIFSLILSLPLFANESKDIQLVDKIAVVVNGKPVLESEIELAKQWFGIQNKKEAAERLIDEILVADAAEKVGLNVTSEEINDAIERLAKANGFPSSESFLETLKEKGIIISEFKEIIKREILGAKFIQIYLKKNLFKGISEGKLVPVRTIRIIYLRKDKPDFPNKYKAVYKGLERGENFSKLAKEYSDDSLTAEKGGLLEDLRKGDLLPALDKEIWKHKVGDTFKVETENGVYFVKIEKEDKKMSVIPPSGEEISSKLKKEFDIFLKKLRENAVIEYLDKDLK